MRAKADGAPITCVIANAVAAVADRCLHKDIHNINAVDSIFSCEHAVLLQLLSSVTEISIMLAACNIHSMQSLMPPRLPLLPLSPTIRCFNS